MAEGEIVRPDRVAQTVRSLLEDAGIGTRNVVAALGGHDVFVKRLEMTRGDGSNTRDLIRREAERHIPFDIRSVHLDFQVLKPRVTAERTGHKVLLVAAQEGER